ncbi:Hypothetical predicted protein [Marmota monax]|uniref:Uncharacterized protein n=1 Tax=Marmota monax TaxID=9995 RepID=A0A5E4ATH9_MARMO|nr:Hypothetical predicted protein [Marmota monax]
MVTGCPFPAAPQNSSPLASSAAVPEQRSRRKKGQKKKQANAKAGRSYLWGQGPGRVGAGAPGAAALLTRGLCSPATQEGSSAASTAAFSEAISQLKLWRRREQKNIWTVDHIQGTKLRMNKRRRPSYRPEDQEAFYRLLGGFSAVLGGRRRGCRLESRPLLGRLNCTSQDRVEDTENKHHPQKQGSRQ